MIPSPSVSKNWTWDWSSVFFLRGSKPVPGATICVLVQVNAWRHIIHLLGDTCALIYDIASLPCSSILSVWITKASRSKQSFSSLFQALITDISSERLSHFYFSNLRVLSHTYRNTEICVKNSQKYKSEKNLSHYDPLRGYSVDIWSIGRRGEMVWIYLFVRPPTKVTAFSCPAMGSIRILTYYHALRSVIFFWSMRVWFTASGNTAWVLLSQRRFLEANR